MATLEEKLNSLIIASNAGLDIHTEAIHKHSEDLRTESLSTMECLSKTISSAQFGIDALNVSVEDLKYNLEQVKADTGRAMTDILDMILNARNEQGHEQEHHMIVK